MYYIRKMSKPPNLSKIKMVSSVEQIDADFIGQEMRTSYNTLSVWRSESLEPSEINKAIKAALFASSELATTQFIILKSDELESLGISLQDSEGNTGYSGLECLHTDICGLTYEKIGKLLELYHEVSAFDDRTPKIQKADFKDIVKNAASQKAINEEKLNEHLKKDIDKLLSQ